MVNQGILHHFTQHKVAANLLMLLMILGGMFALHRLNIQFFPKFELDIISVNVTWTGASSEDIETGITTPLEQSLRNVEFLRKMTSVSAEGSSKIFLELEEGSNPNQVLNKVKQEVDNFRNLPTDAEEPEVTLVTRFEPVARLLLHGTGDRRELRYLAHRFEQELLQRGIAQVTIGGLPEEEIAIEIDYATQQQLEMNLNQIGERIDQQSRDLPAGTFGEKDSAHQLRSLNQARDTQQFSEITIVSDENTRITLGQTADIQRHAIKGSSTYTIDGQPAVELTVERTENSDSLESAAILNSWLEETRASLPPNIHLEIYDQAWQLIKDRISLLVNNGLGGLILVIGILYLFLTPRVAWWVAMGIPVSFMATLLVLYFAGGSINMITLFALVMALGIIVDDAIVVGEDSLAHYQHGDRPEFAAEIGARRMLAPVFASSLTTIAAFLPLMLISGPIGKILFAIPMVIIAAIMASLIECFLVLPGHLNHSFARMEHKTQGKWQNYFNNAFERFRDGPFQRLVKTTIDHRNSAFAVVAGLLILTVGLLAGGRIAFLFFPSPEGKIIQANAYFVPGTPKQTVDRFLDELERAMRRAEKSLADSPLISSSVTVHGYALTQDKTKNSSGDHIGAIRAELIEPDHRSVRNQQFIQAWREQIRLPSALETLSITEQETGPPGRAIAINLSGRDTEMMKAAALELSGILEQIPGVSEVEDTMPYGKEQLIYRLTPTGEALGLTSSSLGEQLRAAFEGQLIQLFQDGPDEVEVRVRLPAAEREYLNSLDNLEIFLQSGETVPLRTVASWESRRGFDSLRHIDTLLSVEVSADVNPAVNNPGRIIATLQESSLPELKAKYNINYSFAGRARDQAETMADMLYGLVMGLMLIYIILAWVFASYGWPLLVMMAIPFGLVGALAGHYLLGVDLTILSMFGFFGLSGIVVNDSIILVSFYKELRATGMPIREALVKASCLRLRAVLLTSLTTVAGLIPLLFETSLQAQFLIPMAISIAFGLAFATVLVLLMIPAMLSLYEEIYWKWQARKTAPAQPRLQ